MSGESDLAERLDELKDRFDEEYGRGSFFELAEQHDAFHGEANDRITAEKAEELIEILEEKLEE